MTSPVALPARPTLAGPVLPARKKSKKSSQVLRRK